MKRGKTVNITNLLIISNIVLLILLLILLAKVDSNLKVQTSSISEKLVQQDVKLNELTEKIISIEEINSLNSKTLEKILAGNLKESDKICEKIRNLKVEKVYYDENLLIVKVNNENNQDIAGLTFNLISNNINKIDSNEFLGSYEVKDYNFNILNVTKVSITPKVSVEGNISSCNKEIFSEVKKYFNIEGTFNVSATVKASDQEKSLNAVATFSQNQEKITASAKVLKETGDYGDPFILEGELIEDKLILNAKEVVIPSGSISGIDREVKADMTLTGIVLNNDYIEGSNQGDIKLNVKDAIPGVTITVDGVFNANRT